MTYSFDKVIPFNVQMNLDIVNLEGNIDVEYVDKLIQKLETYFCVNQISKDEKLIIAYMNMLTSIHYWWKNISTKWKKVIPSTIDTWSTFFEHVNT